MTREHTDTMSQVPTSLKDPSILILQANFNTAHAAVDRSLAEVDKHIPTIEHAKNYATVPKQMLHDYPTRLDAALTQRSKVRSVFSPYKGAFIEKRRINEHLLSCLFSETPRPDPVP